MEASLVVDLDLAVQVVPLVEAGALLVSPALTTVAVELDLFVEKTRSWDASQAPAYCSPEPDDAVVG